MAFVVYRPGARLGIRSLGGLLRDRWALLRDQEEARLEKRRARGTPPSDKKPCDACGQVPEPNPMGEYQGDPGHDEIFVEFKALTLDEFESVNGEWIEAHRSGGDPMAPQERFISEFLCHLSGIEFEDGMKLEFDGTSPTTEQLRLLRDIGITRAIFLGGMHLQGLGAEAKKNCGLSPLPTSEPSTATCAPNPSASAEAAMAAQGTPGLPATPTRAEPARSGSSGRTQSSPGSSESGPSSTTGALARPA